MMSHACLYPCQVQKTCYQGVKQIHGFATGEQMLSMANEGLMIPLTPDRHYFGSHEGCGAVLVTLLHVHGPASTSVRREWLCSSWGVS